MKSKSVLLTTMLVTFCLAAVFAGTTAKGGAASGTSAKAKASQASRKALSKKASSNSDEGAAVNGASDLSEFDRALRLATGDRTKAAHQIIDRLLGKSSDEAAKPTSVPRDRLLMTKARLLYQDGDVRSALKVFEQVPSDSDWWIESLEERAWGHLRIGEHGLALAQLNTLKAPMFKPLVGPEPYFLTGLIHLRVCDYPKVFDSIKTFKTEYRDRLVAIQNLANVGQTENSLKALTKLQSGALTLHTIISEANYLPRFLLRDREFIQHMENSKKGNTKSLTLAGLRLKALAERDVKEMSEILKKMQLLEAEVIQRIHIAEKPKGRAHRSVEIPKGEEVLMFNDTGEFWLDELDRYHVSAKGCPDATGGQKL